MKKEIAVEYAVKNTIFLYIGNFFVSISNFLISIYIIRKLSIEEFGLYSFVLGSFFFVQIFSLSSISTILNRFVPELIERKRFSILKNLLNYSFLIVFISLIFIALLFNIFSKEFSTFFKLPDMVSYQGEITIFLFGYIVLLYVRSLSSSTLLQKETAIMNITASILRVLVYGIFIFNINLKKIFLIESLTSFFNAFQIYFLVILKFIKRNLNNESKDKIENLKKRIVRYGVLSFFNEVGAGMISKSTSYYVISSMSNPVELGKYSFAYKINDLFMKIFPIDQIANVLKPIFFMKYVSKPDDKEYLNRMYIFLYKFFFWVFAFLCFYFISVSDLVIRFVFDPKYIDSKRITDIIFLFTLFNSFQIPLSFVVLSLERLEINLISKISLFFNVVGSIVVIKYFGIIGVAVILGTSILMKNLIIVVLLRKYVKLSFPFVSLLKTTSISLILFFVITVVKNLFVFNKNITAYSFIVVTFILGIFLYYILTKIVNPFDNDEKDIVNSMFKKVKLSFIRL
ncbi:MAG: oligosaccharide flippase family protein [bacterium]|nr:oligosaccharide flippase family protein [bacterium]